MIVVCSTGLNVPPQLVRQYEVALTAQYLMIDDVVHELRDDLPVATLIEWLRNAKEPPYVLGSTVEEFTSLFATLRERTDAVIVVAGSRYGLGTYEAAILSANAFMDAHPSFTVRVVDTGLMELGAGVVAAYCGACAKAGHDIDSIVNAAASLAAASVQLFAPATLDALMTRTASGVSKVISSLTGPPPILRVKKGVIRLSGYFSSAEKIIETLRDALAAELTRGAGVWAAITYAGDDAPARALLGEVQRTFDVQYALVRHHAPAGYIVLGPDSLGVSLHPVDAMPLEAMLPTLD